ncbi:tol-pal system protein YbgF [Fundidesulfovibrio terrae]|uniref:tol-pal system protein YbgF n=1 Tax=Fundidesulfovibrio terrae TaxID=2922866 RepID=UPI00311AA1B2
MKRFGLTVLALALAVSGCAQNKGKAGQEATQASRLDNLEAGFSRFQEQQRARDADIDYKLRDIASRLDRLGQGQPAVPSKTQKGKDHKPAPVAGSRQPVAYGQVIPYSSLASGAPGAPAATAAQPSPQAQPVPATPAPQPLPVLQPPVVTLGESAKQPVPMAAPAVEGSRFAKGKQAARTPQPLASAAQPAPVSSAAPSTTPAKPQGTTPQPAPAAPAAQTAAPQAADVQEQLLYTEALRAVSANHNDEGRRKFNDFLAKYPSSPKTPEALYWIGESYMGDKSYNQAILSFKEVTTRFPKDSKSAEALYRIADAYERLGDKANAAFHLKMLVDEHPSSEFSGKAKQKLKQLGQ